MQPGNTNARRLGGGRFTAVAAGFVRCHLRPLVASTIGAVCAFGAQHPAFALSAGSLSCAAGPPPTVVFDAGLGGDRRDWRAVTSAIGSKAGVCTWDRPGRGNGGPLPGGRPLDLDQVAEDLHRALAAAHMRGTVMLVGHSTGGDEVRLFAIRYPGQVAGLVLSEPTITPELMAGPNAITNNGETLAVHAAAHELSRARVAADLPLAVIERGQDRDPGWARAQARLSGQSADSLLIEANDSDHGVPFEQPRLIAAVVLREHQAIRDRARLRCSAAIRAAGGSCLAPGTVLPASTGLSPAIVAPAAVAALAAALLGVSTVRRRRRHHGPPALRAR